MTVTAPETTKVLRGRIYRKTSRGRVLVGTSFLTVRRVPANGRITVSWKLSTAVKRKLVNGSYVLQVRGGTTRARLFTGALERAFTVKAPARRR